MSLHEPPVAPAGHDHVDTHASHTHVVPIWLLVLILICLLILTFITVAVTHFDFGQTVNVWVALLIAAAKGALVVLFFMHLRWDSPFNGLCCVAALFFVALFIGITILDTRETYVNYTPPPVTAARPQ